MEGVECKEEGGEGKKERENVSQGERGNREKGVRREGHEISPKMRKRRGKKENGGEGERKKMGEEGEKGRKEEF